MDRFKIISTVSIILFIGLLITSCEDAGDRTNNEMYGNEKSALTVRINNTIDRIDAKIDELENRLDTANEETAENINDQVDKLKDRIEE
jgi:peptidoglycan hydrolase CwlO-like protein